jgi:hypothetical protein
MVVSLRQRGWARARRQGARDMVQGVDAGVCLYSSRD